MESASLFVGDVPAVAPGARHYRLECSHGSTWALTLPGRTHAGDALALELLVLRHRRSTGCHCADQAPERAEPGWATAAV
jgi:hypothetical protein